MTNTQDDQIDRSELEEMPEDQQFKCPNCGELMDAGVCDTCGHGRAGTDYEADDFTRPFGVEDD